MSAPAVAQRVVTLSQLVTLPQPPGRRQTSTWSRGTQTPRSWTDPASSQGRPTPTRTARTVR